MILSLPKMAYGTWRMAEASPKQAQHLLETAIEVGMNLIDTADVYGFGTTAGFGGVEALIGEVFTSSPSLRDKIILATKGGVDLPVPYNASKDYLISACEASLQRLGVEQIDIYMVHRPDFLAAPQETAQALTQLHTEGKIKSLGVSNYTTSQVEALRAFLGLPLICNQVEFSVAQLAPLYDGTLDHCQQLSIKPMAWSPLAGGNLNNNPSLVTCLNDLAAKYDVTQSQIALAFLLRHPATIMPVIGTQTPQRIEEAAAATTITLTQREWYSIIEASRSEKMP